MKNGVNYFPLDVHLDDNIKLIEAEYGLKGFAVIIKLYQKIYGTEGYFCDWSSEVALLFSREVGMGRNVVSEIIEKALNRGIFNKKLYDRYHILTSKGIQERYFTIVKRRKSVNVKNEYLLVSCTQKSQAVYKNGENADINNKNEYRNKQRKEKERKVNKSKENIYRGTEKSFIKPTLEEVQKYCIKRNNKIDYMKFFDFYESNGWMVGRNKMKDWKACIRTWEKNNMNFQKSPKKETIQADIDYFYENNFSEEEIERIMNGD